MNRHLLAIGSLWQRELVRFFRQRNRVVGALGPPLLIWVFIGSGFGASFRLPGNGDQNYMTYFYPGIIVLVVLFTSIFSAMSVIEDRRDGYLQGLLAAPIARSSLVIGKVLGGTTQAFVQACLLLLVAPLIGVSFGLARVIGTLGMLAIVSFSLTAFGFMMAWRTDSMQGYHAIMNLLLMPMWILSGAFFPLASAPTWLHILMRFNPLTYGVAALRGSMYGAEAVRSLTEMSFQIAALVTAGFAVVIAGAAVAVARRPSRTS